MSTPYGGNDPQQWGQTPQAPGSAQQPQSGGFPAQGHPQQQPQSGGFPAEGYPQQQPQSGGFPAEGYPQQQPQSGGFPAEGYPQQQQPQYGQYPQQPQYGQQPGYPQQQPQYPQQQPGQQQPYYGQQQPGQYDYGQTGGFGAPVKKTKGGGKLLWIITAVVIVVVAAVGVTGFLVPGFFITKVLDQTSVQNGVKQMLGTYGDTATSVSCPAKQEVKAGTTFTCTATIGGKQQQVTVTVQNDNGDYQVGHPQ
jgi:hypothetical protein